MRAIICRGLPVALLAWLTLVISPGRAAADPVRITSNLLRIGGAQDFGSRGFLRSISYDLSIADIRLTASDSDGPRQDPFRPIMDLPGLVVAGGSRLVLLTRAPFTFTAIPNLMPTPFAMSGSLSVVDRFSGEPLFNGDVFGSGLATFRFVTTPNGDSVVSGVTYQFAHPSATPEPGTLLLFGSGAATMLWKRRRRGCVE